MKPVRDAAIAGVGAQKLERAARWVVIVAVLASGLQGILSSRAFFADGAFVMWKIVTDNGFFFTADRVVAQFVTQLPLVLGLTAGLTDTHVLAVLFGIGIVGIPWLAWAGAFAILRRDSFFWPMVAIFSATFLTTSFMAVGEYNFASGFVALCMALLLRGNFSPWRAVVLVTSAAFLTVSYQSLLFLGPLLAFTAGWRLFEALTTKPRKNLFILGLSLAIICFLTGAGFSIYWTLNPRDPGNLSQAGRLLHSIKQDPSFLAALAVCAAIMVVYAYPLKQKFFSTFVLVFLSASPLLLLLFPLFAATPLMHYEARTASQLVLFFALGFLAWLRFHESRPGRYATAIKETKYSKFWIPAFVLFVAQLTAMASLTIGFTTWLEEFSTIAETSNSEIPYEGSASLLAGSPRYMWFWTNPYLSRIVAPSCEGGIVQPPSGTSLKQMGMPYPARLPGLLCPPGD